MSNRKWVENIADTLGNICDETFQRRAWFGIGPEVSSPDELFNQLFDDYSIEDFVRRPPIYLSTATVTAINQAIEAMQAIEEEYLSVSLIDDPRWIEVRALARTARTSLLSDIAN